LVFQVFDLPVRRFLQVFLAKDIVAVKYTPGLMPLNLHCHHFTNSRPQKISNSRSSEIVEDLPCPFCLALAFKADAGFLLYLSF
jgi:hypothetical protein